MRVLIVDDEHRARKRLTRMLRAIDSVDICGEADDGLGALEAIEKEKPDVVLLDVQMPGIDGFEVLNGLRGRTVP